MGYSKSSSKREFMRVLAFKKKTHGSKILKNPNDATEAIIKRLNQTQNWSRNKRNKKLTRR
jgi:hypothetical protein